MIVNQSTTGFYYFFLTSINDYSLYLKLFLLGFAQRICDEYGGPNPRRGKKNDEAHPPIHPTKYSANLQGWNFLLIYVEFKIFQP